MDGNFAAQSKDKGIPVYNDPFTMVCGHNSQQDEYSVGENVDEKGNSRYCKEMEDTRMCDPGETPPCNYEWKYVPVCSEDDSRCAIQ